MLINKTTRSWTNLNWCTLWRQRSEAADIAEVNSYRVEGLRLHLLPHFQLLRHGPATETSFVKIGREVWHGGVELKPFTQVVSHIKILRNIFSCTTTWGLWNVLKQLFSKKYYYIIFVVCLLKRSDCVIIKIMKTPQFQTLPTIVWHCLLQCTSF